MMRRRFLLTMGLGLTAPNLFAATSRKRPALEAVEKRRPIPDFTLTDLEGVEHRPEDYRGSVLLINFWATWCSPCLAEMASIARMLELQRDKPFNILAVAMHQSAEQLREYAAKNPQPFPLLPDSDGAVSEAFGVQGLPTTYLASRAGQLTFRAEGGRQWDSPRMQRAITLLLSTC